MLPQDNMMLLSIVNMKLRDEYSNLDDLCSSMDEDKSEIVERLRSIGFEYDEETNSFR